MIIQASRFSLHDFQETDRAAFVLYHTEPRYRLLYDDANEQWSNDLFDAFASWRNENPRRNFQLGIFETRTGRLCGCAGLRTAGEKEGTAAFGIELTPDDWGRYRLAIEVADALIGHGFRNLGLHVIVGDAASGNARVEKLARWFGADIIAHRTGSAWMQARGWREVRWSLSRKDWEKARRRNHP